VDADAEHLPFEDESFDVVMSSIGAVFAPHHHQVARARLPPDGTIRPLSWTPEGMIGALFQTMAPLANVAKRTWVAVACGSHTSCASSRPRHQT
jgi:hypothetical protein